jgi:hypothetical protein
MTIPFLSLLKTNLAITSLIKKSSFAAGCISYFLPGSSLTYKNSFPFFSIENEIGCCWMRALIFANVTVHIHWDIGIFCRIFLAMLKEIVQVIHEMRFLVVIDKKRRSRSSYQDTAHNLYESRHCFHYVKCGPQLRCGRSKLLKPNAELCEEP